MRRRSTRLAAAGSGVLGDGSGGPPPSGDDGGRGGASVGAQEHFPGNRARMQRGERVDARPSSASLLLPECLNPIVHWVAAHETRADLAAG
jgi:hypothetical protein